MPIRKDDDTLSIPDGYGLGLARGKQGSGSLSGLVTGAKTHQRTVALGLTDAIAIAAAHSTAKRSVALALADVITIRASHVTPGARTFVVTLADSVGGSTPKWSTYTVSVTVASGGGSQTNGRFYVVVQAVGIAVGGPTSSVGNGWSQTGWTLFGGYWSNYFTKAAVPVATALAATVQIVTNNDANSVTTDASSPSPQTDQVIGSGNAIVTTLT